MSSSLVFRVISSDIEGVTNRIGLFNKSLSSIWNDIRSKQSIGEALFGNRITSNDVTYLKNYLEQVQSGVSHTTAFNATMGKASAAGKKMAQDIAAGKKSISDFETAAGAARLSVNGLQIAMAAFNIALSVGLAIAIPKIIGFVDDLAHAEKKAAEAAEEVKSKSNSALSEAKDEADKIDELIKKYKELASSETQDVSTRQEIKEIQGDISELVGKQADNLDLVNGKLDDQLSKLEQIQKAEAEDVVSKTMNAYHDARNVVDTAIASEENYYGFDGYVYAGNKKISGDHAAKETEIAEYLRANGYLLDVGYSPTGYVEITDSSKLYGRNQREGAEEKLEYINGMIKAIQDNINDYSSTELYQALVRQSNNYQSIVNDVSSSAQELLNAVLDVSRYDNDLSNITVNSVDTFIQYRDKLIDVVSNSPELAEALSQGSITNQQIEEQVDSYLNTLPNVSDYYDDWKEWRSDLEKLPDILNNFAKASGSPQQPETMQEFRNWIDNLSHSDKELVYKISTEYSNEKVKEQLEKYSDGGTVDLLLRPKVDGKELEKAGWGEQGDYGTVLTSTESNKDGSIAINFTPIVTDGNGKYVETLTPDELHEYAQDVINGIRDDDLNLQIGAKFTGKDAIDQAVNAAKQIHLLQDYYYDLGDPSNFNLEKWQNAITAYKDMYAVAGSNFEYLLNNRGTAKNPEFIDTVDDYIEQITNLNGALEKFQKGDFESDDFNKLIRKFPELATRSGDLDVAINELKDSLSEDMFEGFQAQMDNMNTDEDIADLTAFRDAILEIGKAADDVSTKFSTDNGKTQKVLSGITAAQKIVSSQKKGKTISLSDFSEDEVKDYRSALEYVNGAMQFNVEKVNEIAKAKAKEQIEINKTNKALAQSKYIKNAKQIEKYRSELKSATDDKKRFNLQTNIDKLVAENNTIIATCTQYDMLVASLKEATDSYKDWVNATEASDFGDIFTDAQTAIDRIKDTFDETSDTYGNFGSTKFKADVEFIIPETIDRKDTAAIEKYIEDLNKYFYSDEDGKTLGMDIAKFCQDAVTKGLMVFDQSSEEYKIAGSKTMEDFADGLNLSSGMVQAFFDEMQLYGGDFNWGDEIEKTLKDVTVEAYEAAESLRSIKDNKDFKIKLDFSDIETTDGQIKAIDATIKEMDAIKAKPKVDTSEIDKANAVLEYCVMQKQSLTAPDVMKVDTTKVNQDIRDAIALLQEFQTSENNVEILNAVKADTTQAEEDVDSVVEKIQGLSPEIKSKLGFDKSVTKESIEKYIKDLGIDKLLKIGIDKDAISGSDSDDTEVDVKYKPDTSELLEEEDIEPLDTTVNYIPDMSKLPDSSDLLPLVRKVIYVAENADDSNDPIWRSTHAWQYGQGHVSGTAKANGDWGTAKGGKTLVGELGKELVVNVRTGKWYTVGDNGAEFVDIPEGAIVFNHLQTESLLANGYVSGRAHALVSGTALAGGISGGITLSNTKYKINKKKDTTTESETSSTDTGEETVIDPETPEIIEETVEEAKQSEKVIDRVSIAIDRLQRKISNVANAIGNIFTLWSNRGDSITKQISNITEEIDTQRAAAERYLEEANRQIGKYGLDENWVKSIQDGSISFAYLTNLDELYEGYQEYQKWYEKYLESRDSIISLEQNLSQLYKDQFDNIKSNYENQISLNDYLYDSNQMTYLQSTTYFEDMQEIYEKNLALSVEEVAELERQLQNAVDSGAIEEGSEAWQDMQKSINDVNKEVSTLNTSLADLFDKRFSNIQSRYGDIIKDLDIVDWDSDNVDYDSHIESQRKSIQLLEEEGIKLTEVLDEAVASKRIQEGSEEWYKMRDGIKGVNKELAEAKTNLADLYVKEASQITSRYDNEIGLLDVIDTDINNTDYEAHLEAQREIIKLSKDEAKELNEVLSKGLASGEIVKGTSSWYQLKDSIDSVTKSAVEAKKQLAELRKQEFDSIQTKFENRLTPYDSDLKFFEWQSSELQANGYVQSSELYQRMQENMRTSMKKTLDQAEAMQESLDNAVDSGEIKLYSDTWYEMKNAIESARQSARNFNLEIDELQKKREDLAKENFNFFQDQLSGRIDENQFYIDLLSKTDMYDKQGRPTDTGLASMALHFDNADLNLNKTRDYQIALDTVNYRISQDPANKELLEYREELIKLQRESILASEKEQEAVIDYVENGIKVELDSLKDLIDKHKDALDSAKELYDYQNKIADKTKNIATIQKQLSAYSLDSSEETKATVQKLKVELENAEKDLSETEYDKSVSEQKQLMDTLYTQYETFLNSRLDDTNGILNDMRLVVNALPGEIKGVLDNAAASVGTSLSEEMGTKWQNAADALREWNESHSEAFQVSLDTASSSWGAFGENLRGSVIDQYDYIDLGVNEVGDNVNDVLSDAENLKTAVGRNTVGIQSIFGDMEHQTGQIVANNNANQSNVINGLRDVDDATYRYVYRSGDDVSKKNADNLQERTKEIQNYIYENLNNTTTADEVRKIRKLANDVAREANKVTKEAEMQTDEAKKQTQLLKGDVDKDGVITSSDALRILRASAGLDTLTDLEESLADVNGDGVFDSADALAVLRMSAGFGTKKYKKGGLADFTGLAQLDGSKSNPEVVLDPQDSKNLIKLRDLMRKISSEQGDLLELKGFDIAAPQLTALSNLSKGLIGVNNPQMSNTTTINLGGISIDHVQDYNDFMNQMKKDPKFEKLIHSIESDKMTGGNSLSKLNYRW